MKRQIGLQRNVLRHWSCFRNREFPGEEKQPIRTAKLGERKLVSGEVHHGLCLALGARENLLEPKVEALDSAFRAIELRVLYSSLRNASSN
jgi:hypothetical protein